MVKYILFFLLINSTIYACSISITLKTINDETVENAIVVIDNQHIKINKQGRSNLIDLKEGIYAVSIYENNELIDTQTITINCKIKDYHLIVVPKDKIEQLDEVVISTHTVKQKLESSPFSVQVIDMKNEYDKVGDVGNILNKSIGIKVRSDGNLGSPTQVNLGGMQGKAIQIFKDGIPIELFGHGFNITTIPSNMLERIEVYKGPMPVYLASDALGGGINLVTRYPKSNLAEVSYEIGSFNTHRATANVFITNKHNPSYYFGMNTAYNYSQNNYMVNAPFINSDTGQKYYKNVKRFHDATKSYYGEAFIGVQNKEWVDDIRLTLIFSNFYKEIQNDSEMRKVYGKPFNEEQNYASLLSYKKEFFNNKLNLNSILAYSRFNTKLVDTATVRYNWDGEKILSDQIVGEINKGGSNQKLHYDLFSTRVNAIYKITDNQVVEFGELFYHQRRKGSDPLGAISPIYNIDVLTIPATYQKNVMALALRSYWFDRNIESVFAVKRYNSKTEGFTTDKFNFAWQSSKSNSLFGYLMGLKWNLNNYVIKASYEYATRLPDELEIFGDGILIKENLDLIPEQSHNVNLNTQYSFEGKNNKGSVVTNLFYRRVHEAIFLQPDIPYKHYINFHEVEIYGIEFEANYNIKNRFDIGLNGTYQDIRRVSEKDYLTIYEGSRVANIPFLFGNVFFNYSIGHLFKKEDKLSLRLSSNYVHRFYLTDIPKNQEPPLFGNATQVSSELIIPNNGKMGQLSNDFGVYYQFANKKVFTTLEVLNIGNTRLYDNLNVQKPGRSLHFKIVYKIN